MDQFNYILPIAIAVISASSALAGVLISNKHNEKVLAEERKQKWIEKASDNYQSAGEELFTIFSKWSRFVIVSQSSLYAVMKGKLTYNQHLDLYTEYGKKCSETIDIGRIEFLQSKYFPEMKALRQVNNDALRHINDIINDHKEAYEAGSDGQVFLEQFAKAHEEFEKSSTEYKEAIVQKLNNSLPYKNLSEKLSK